MSSKSKKIPKPLERLVDYALKYPPSGKQGKNATCIVGAIPYAEFDAHEKHIRKLMKEEAANYCKDKSEKLTVFFRGPRPKPDKARRYGSLKPATTLRKDATSVSIYVSDSGYRFDSAMQKWTTETDRERDRYYQERAEKNVLISEVANLKGLLETATEDIRRKNNLLQTLSADNNGNVAVIRRQAERIDELTQTLADRQEIHESALSHNEYLKTRIEELEAAVRAPISQERVVEMTDTSSINREVFIKIVGEPTGGAIADAVKSLVLGGAEVQLIQKYTKR